MTKIFFTDIIGLVPKGRGVKGYTRLINCKKPKLDSNFKVYTKSIGHGLTNMRSYYKGHLQKEITLTDFYDVKPSVSPLVADNAASVVKKKQIYVQNFSQNTASKFDLYVTKIQTKLKDFHMEIEQRKLYDVPNRDHTLIKKVRLKSVEMKNPEGAAKRLITESDRTVADASSNQTTTSHHFIYDKGLLKNLETTLTTNGGLHIIGTKDMGGKSPQYVLRNPSWAKKNTPNWMSEEFMRREWDSHIIL